MRSVKCILSLLLCAALIFSVLTACGQKGGDDSGANSDAAQANVTYGRYVEHDITPEGMTGSITNFISFGGGVLDIMTRDVFGGGQQEHWRSEDNGETWQELDMSWLLGYSTPEDEEWVVEIVSQPISSGGLLSNISMLPVGGGQLVTDERALNKLVLIDENGQETHFEPEFIQDLQNSGALYRGLAHFNTGLAVLPNDRFMCVYFGIDELVNCVVGDIKTGETLYELNDISSTQVKWNDDTLYIYDRGGKLFTFELETGIPCEVPLPDITVQHSLSSAGVAFIAFSNHADSKAVCIDDDGIFYTITPEGLRRHGQTPQNTASMLAGSLPQNNPALQGELILDGLNYTFGSPLYDIRDMLLDKENEGICVAVNAVDAYGRLGQGKLLRYVWNDNAIATSSDKLSVFSLYKSDTINLMLSEFKRIRPDVTIEYNTAFDRRPGASAAQAGVELPAEQDVTPTMVEEAIHTLNTQLLAGEGPDVIFLDDLSLVNLVRNDMLADITDFVNNESNIMRAVIEPMLIESRAYAIPTSFAIPILFGSSADIPVQSLEALAAAVSAGANLPESATDEPLDATDRPFINAPNIENLFDALYPSSAAAIFPQQSSVDAAALESFLQAIKTISDKYKLTSFANSGEVYNTLLSFSAAEFADRRASTGYDILTTPVQFDDIAFLLHWSQAPLQTQEEGEQTQGETPVEDLQVAYAPMPGLASSVYLPTQVVGITSTARQPEVAMEFLSTLLSDDLQANNMGAGLPVTQSGFDAALQSYNIRIQESSDIITNTRIIPTTDTLLEMVDALSTPYYENTYLHDTMLNAARQYCEGSLTLPAAVSQVENDTRFYFAERQ